jgi:type III secretion protein C
MTAVVGEHRQSFLRTYSRRLLSYLGTVGALFAFTAHSLSAQDLPDWFRTEQSAQQSSAQEDKRTGYVSGYDERRQPTLPSALPYDDQTLIADETVVSSRRANSNTASPAPAPAPPPSSSSSSKNSSSAAATTTTDESSSSQSTLEFPMPPATFEGASPAWMVPNAPENSPHFQGSTPRWMERQKQPQGQAHQPLSQVPASATPALITPTLPTTSSGSTAPAPSTMSNGPAAPALSSPSSGQQSSTPASAGGTPPTPVPPTSSSQPAAPRSPAQVIFQPAPSPEEVEQQQQANVVYPSPISTSQQRQITTAQQGFRINFQNVPIVEYLRWVGQIAGVNFIYQAEELNFAVTIVSEEPTSVENIMAALLQVLQVHGLLLAEQGNNILIYQDASLATIAPVIDSAEDQLSPATPPIITRVYRVYNANPSSLANLIIPLLSHAAIVEASPDTGHLVVTDLKTNIDKVSELITALDNPKTQVEIVAYHVQYVDPVSLASIAQKMMAPIAAGQPLLIVPQGPTKTIFVVSTPYLDAQAISLLEKLDVPGAENIPLPSPAQSGIPQPGGQQGLPSATNNMEGTNFEIYKLQYNAGSDIVTSLHEIATSLAEGGLASSELVATIKTIQWLKTSNSLVLTGSMAAIQQTVDLIAQIDVPLKQVLLEMLIIQTTLQNSLSFGVEWASVAQAGADFSGAIASTPAGVSTGAFTLPNVRPNFPAGSLPLLPGLAADAIGSIIKRNTTHFWSIQALVQALETEQDMEIISNQKLLVQDSKTASIFVGQQIAFSEGTIAFGSGTDFATSSFDYRNIGTAMQITPYIGNSPIITLEIAQEVSETLTPITGGTSSSSAFQNPTTDKTTTVTRVHVPDRHFLILCGQIRGESQTNRSGLPCLGSLPIIGGVFASTSEAVIKNNLIIFIRPHIVATVEEMIQLTREQRHQFEEWNTLCPLQLNLREWLNLPNGCRPLNFPYGRCTPMPCVTP